MKSTESAESILGKRKRNEDLQASLTTIASLPIDILNSIFKTVSAETKTSADSSTLLLAERLRAVSKAWKENYDNAITTPRWKAFISTITQQYKITSLKSAVLESGNIYVTSNEEGKLAYHLRTLRGEQKQGILHHVTSLPLTEEKLSQIKGNIFRELSESILYPEIKESLAQEMALLLQNKENILTITEQSEKIQKYFAHLEEIQQNNQLDDKWHLLACEHNIEQINTEIMQAKIKKAVDKTKLKCNACCLTRFPKTVLIKQENARFWSQLKMLDLDNNHLQSLPPEIGQLEALEILYLNSNHLQSLPAEIGQLKALEGLEVDNNHLQSLPAEIGQLKALEWLTLEYNHLQSLPAEIGQLEALERLYLKGNYLQSLPAEIGQLTWLPELYLKDNYLQSVPAVIEQLKALTKLSLNNNQLTVLPVWLKTNILYDDDADDYLYDADDYSDDKEILLKSQRSNLAQEITLLIQNKKNILQITEQSEKIQKCFAHLEEIQQNNQLYDKWHLLDYDIEQINAEIMQRRIKKSVDTILDCSACCLTRFPKTVLTKQENAHFWSQLQWLSLTNNHLQRLPPEIGQLRALQWLNLHNNHLQDLPAEIEQLEALKELCLSYNQLQSVPAAIEQLGALTKLSLNNNQLTALPIWLKENILYAHSYRKINKEKLLKSQRSNDDMNVERSTSLKPA